MQLLRENGEYRSISLLANVLKEEAPYHWVFGALVLLVSAGLVQVGTGQGDSSIRLISPIGSITDSMEREENRGS